MATMQGITGKLSGKMGSAVFRVREGQQVVTQYNPIVKNPNTDGQQTQRAKFKLMSQLAAVMAPGFGTMSVNTRKAKGKPSQRNAFTQLNFPLVEVTSEDATVTAKIPMDQLKLTSSFRELGDISGTTQQGSNLKVVISLSPGSRVKKGKIVLVGYGTMTPTKGPTIVQIVDVPVSNNSINYTFENIVPDDYTVLAYGLIPSESAKASIDLDNIHTPEDEDFISAVELNAMVANGSIVETKTIGKNVSIV